MSVTRTPNLKIGDLVTACEDGKHAFERGRPCRLPGWTTGSPTLAEAFREGYDNARRRRKATDGPAR